MVVALIILVAVGGVFAYISSKSAGEQSSSPKIGGVQVIVFKSPTCGCCAVYAKYLGQKDYDVQVKDVPDPSAEMKKKGFPDSMLSCHTSIIGDYVVEGHVPVEAIEKLLAEKPAIKGIAMPGMPSGSPGMPGSKNGPFIIYKITDDGSVEEFMRM